MFKSTEEIDAIRRRCNDVENNLIDRFLTGRIARREFLRHGAVLGISAPLIAGLAACADATSYPLDLVPGAIAAYSFRKLRSAYAGKAVQVRRSSDNALQDIGFSGNKFDAAGFAAFIGGGSGFVVTWYDQVGSANATQATEANQPTLVTGITPNGTPAAFSAGGNSLLAGTISATVVAFTLATVCNRTGNFTNYTVPFCVQGGPSGNNNPGFFYYNTANGGISFTDLNTGTPIPSAGGHDNSFHSAIGIANFAASSCQVDGGTASTGVMKSNAGALAVHIMSDNLSSPLTGYVAEGIYFGNAMTAGNVAKLALNLRACYGTP